MSHDTTPRPTPDDQAVVDVLQQNNGWEMKLECGHKAIARRAHIRRVKQVKVMACLVCKKKREEAERFAREAERAAIRLAERARPQPATPPTE
jgi:hypothetical protein